MGRRRRGTRDSSSSTPAKGGAEISVSEWSTSNPTRPATHVLYCYKEDKVLVVTFCARFAAYHFLYHLQEGEGDYKWSKRKTESGHVIRHGITYESGLRVETTSAEELEELVEGPELEEPYASWELPEPYPQQIRILKYYNAEQMETMREQRAKATAPRAQRSAKPSKAGLVTIQSIGDELKIDQRECRQILRKHAKKPAVGWAWPDDEVAGIRELLTKHRKAGV